MSYISPEKFTNVTAICKANVYFDGKVVSHSILQSNGDRKTFGLIYPGSYRFDTGAAEVMEIIAGNCQVRIAGEDATREYCAGTFFEVPGNSYFTIAVETGLTEYVCSFK